MYLSKKILPLFLCCLFFSALSAAMFHEKTPDKRILDDSKKHDANLMWLRVTNLGILGSESLSNQYPSLEYPADSGVDYLNLATIWIGAKKHRRHTNGDLFYWRNWPPQNDYDYITASHPEWNSNMRAVVDTLTSVGFDGDLHLMELLPAWNPLETQNPGYADYNTLDGLAVASTRNHRRGQDNDGDGMINEDPVGRSFPFKPAHLLPEPFQSFGGKFAHELGTDAAQIIRANLDLWHPYNFYDLTYSDPLGHYVYSSAFDDDGDGRIDEDGSPISEQDFIAYYYDYSPFNGPAFGILNRTYGISANGNTHFPLNIRVRQTTYQWSYDFINNVTFLRYEITNMNQNDTLYDLAIGMYVDADIKPQNSDDDQAMHDLSGYIIYDDNEIAYSRNNHPNIAPHWLALTTINPDSKDLNYMSWTYGRFIGGPNDSSPTQYNFPYGNPMGRNTANEKYWLMTGRNPSAWRFENMKQLAEEEGNSWEQPTANNTRFLYGIYGDQQGYTNPTARSLNLAPGETINIVFAMFMGEDAENLKHNVKKIKEFYGEAQSLASSKLPDVSLRYLDLMQFIPPKNLTAISAGSNVTLNWSNVVSTNNNISYLGYNVYRNDDLIAELDLNANSFTDNNVTHALYTYKVRTKIAYNGKNYESEPIPVRINHGNISIFDVVTNSKNELIGSYPNPFNPETNISFNVVKESLVEIEIFNIRGQKIKNLLNEIYPSGKHTIIWNGTDDNGRSVSSGVYFYQMRSEDFTSTRRMVLMK